MEARDRKFAGSTFSAGSALILTVVLTSLLAIVGVLFVMMARVDKVATSAISENRELNLAIETVIAKISQELVLDIPGVRRQEEYYDYPDVNNAWLASLEPDVNIITGNYEWRQISDVTGDINRRWGIRACHSVDVRPLNLSTTEVVREYPEITLDINGELVEQSADADGDGIADSKWIELGDITSNKGKPIYAAIRIVDLDAMLNVNTAYKFNPFDPCASHIDGSSQMQINLAGFARPVDDINDIDVARCGSIAPVSISRDWRAFQQNVIWRTGIPASGYLPFDVSDELELRYRYCITSKAQTRLENVWDYTIGDDASKSLSFKGEPYAGGTFGTLAQWQRAVTDLNDPNNYRRHLLTTYNMDRIIDPNGDLMININRETSPWKIYNTLLSSNLPLIPNAFTRRQYAQLAVNMVDFADSDDINGDGVLDANSVTTFVDPYDPCLAVYCGFEAQPFFSEIAWRIDLRPETGANYYAIELYNPFNAIIDLNDFVLEFVDRYDSANRYYIGFLPGDFIHPNGYFVIVNALGGLNIYSSPDPNTITIVKVDPRLRFFGTWGQPDRSKPPIDPRPDPDKRKPPVPGGWTNSYDVFLQRRVFVPALGTAQLIYVDKWLIDSFLATEGSQLYFGRSLSARHLDWHVVYQTPIPVPGSGTLGIVNGIPRLPEHIFSFFLPNPLNPRAKFVTVGDIPRVLAIGHDTTRFSTVGEQLGTKLQSQENQVRLDLANLYQRNVFQYLTVFDPNSDNIDNDADGLIDGADIVSPELQIPGRININTAPWYVIAQLPWMTGEVAQAIVAYRDKVSVPPVDYSGLAGRFNATGIVGVREQPGFASTGELNFVVNNTGFNNYNIGLYALDGAGADLPGFPDLTIDGLGLGDGIENDFEERDVIFSRISNLVSVRSDVFTAYILVRIGADGPQKRVIAILDRSGVNKANVRSPGGRVRIVALHYVPDPR